MKTLSQFMAHQLLKLELQDKAAADLKEMYATR